MRRTSHAYDWKASAWHSLALLHSTRCSRNDARVHGHSRHSAQQRREEAEHPRCRSRCVVNFRQSTHDSSRERLNGNACQTGTWKSGPGEVASAVKTALQNGYKHLDLAWIYGNEQEVGQGIRDSGVPRDEIFITSKLWCTKHRDVEAAIKESLDLIGTDYLDLCTFPFILWH